jgi:predicted membrane protein
MRRPQVIIGTAILVLGVVLLVSNLTGIDICAYLFPLILIGIGVWIVTRPTVLSGGKDTEIRLIGDIRRRGKWAVREQNFWCGAGDIRLDLTAAIVPEGETTLKLYGFVNDVTLIVPETVGISVVSTSFLTSAHVFGNKQDYFLTVYETETDPYAIATRRVRLELFYFVADLKIRKSPVEASG